MGSTTVAQAGAKPGVPWSQGGCGSEESKKGGNSVQLEMPLAGIEPGGIAEKSVCV